MPHEYGFLAARSDRARASRPTSSSASCGRSTAAARGASDPTRACSSGRCASSTSTITTTTRASARSTSSTPRRPARRRSSSACCARRTSRSGADVAEALYVGLVTDTGRFQYANTTPEAFRLAARLVDAGAQPARVFAAIWETVPFAKQRLLGIALEHARLEASGRLLVTWLTRDDYQSAGADEPFSEGVVDHLRAVEGVERRGARARAARARRPAAQGLAARARRAASTSRRSPAAAAAAVTSGAAGFTSDETLQEIVAFLRASVA